MMRLLTIQQLLSDFKNPIQLRCILKPPGKIWRYEGVAADHTVVDYWPSTAGHIVLCSSMSVVPQKS